MVGMTCLSSYWIKAGPYHETFARSDFFKPNFKTAPLKLVPVCYEAVMLINQSREIMCLVGSICRFSQLADDLRVSRTVSSPS